MLTQPGSNMTGSLGEFENLYMYMLKGQYLGCLIHALASKNWSLHFYTSTNIYQNNLDKETQLYNKYNKNNSKQCECHVMQVYPPDQ